MFHTPQSIGAIPFPSTLGPAASPPSAHWQQQTPSQLNALLMMATNTPAQTTPNMQAHGAAPSCASGPSHAPFSVGGASFGRGMFAELDGRHAASASSGGHSAQSLHFPTASHDLLHAGFHRSAGLLLECALTFYSAGLDASRTTHTYKPYRPAAADITSIPPPEAMALFGQCCLAAGEWKRAAQYLKTALVELSKKKRSAEYATNGRVQQMNMLSHPEKEWTLNLVDALLHAQEEAQAQKLLEQMYSCMLANPSPVGGDSAGTTAMPPKYLLILARFYAMPPQQTSPSVAQQYLTHKPSAAIAIHTLLLKHYPLAIESALELIRLQVDPRPIVAQALAAKYPAHAHSSVQSTSLQQQSLFLHLFLTAHYNLAHHRLDSALALEEGGLNFLINLAPRSMHLLETKAAIQLATTDQDQALRTLERMHAIDPYSLDSMDVLALLYIRSQGRSKELQILMAHCLRVDETRPESWLVAACAAVGKDGFSTGKEKALKYLEKASVVTNSTAGTLVSARDVSPARASMFHTLRGTLHLEWERSSSNDRRANGQPLLPMAPVHYETALKEFRRATLLNPTTNHLATLGLAQVYVHQATLACSSNPSGLAQHSGFKTALALVNAPVSLPEHARNPRIHANAGLILAQVQEGRQKAAKLLHKAMQLESEYSEAVLALAEMYCDSQQYTDALTMLLQYTKKSEAFLAAGGSPGDAAKLIGRRDYFLVKIGQLHAIRGDVEEATNFYKAALAANPGCTAAQEGMQKVEQDAKGTPGGTWPGQVRGRPTSSGLTDRRGWSCSRVLPLGLASLLLQLPSMLRWSRISRSNRPSPSLAALAGPSFHFGLARSSAGFVLPKFKGGSHC